MEPCRSGSCNGTAIDSLSYDNDKALDTKDSNCHRHAMCKTYTQVPIAIIGMACRLPGHCSTPKDFWDFMVRGGIASNEPPANRFNLAGHYDSSRKPYTMKTPGAMFMEDVDPADFDAQFFSINESDAAAMDPQQRNLMEVTYECLENAGVSMEKLSGKRVGSLVGASAVDYYDLDLKDVEDRTESPTIGSSRSLLSNRISHFLNVHGPSMSVDTACSSALTALDMACLYLGNNQVDAMFVGGVNMYLSPERNEDMGNMRAAASPSGRCHAFDSKADGYVAAEAINVVFLKRLDDAIRDHDPVRAVIRGTSTNSAGRTPGISMPNPVAQAQAIRDAYRNAGLSLADLVETGYLECHGTGTLAGDPIEIEGVASVFASTRPVERPLAIGSVKGNIGHSEAASGLTSVIKVVLATENGTIPGTATFLDPNPRIDFEKSRVKAFHNPIDWPRWSKRRASINSFGFGGANAHAIIESPSCSLPEAVLAKFKNTYVNSDSIDADFFSGENKESNLCQSKPKVIILSANDETSLRASIKRLSAHVLNPAVDVDLNDLAYTLSERRSHLYYRAFSIQKTAQMSPASFVVSKVSSHETRIGFIFTGQGSQWSTMGRDLLRTFPIAKAIVETLDSVLAKLSQPPKWTLLSKLTEEWDPAILREPEISQPIVTALQLAYLGVLTSWGIKPAAVAGHSSGEIAAAVASGYLSAEEAIQVAFLRGQAIKSLPPSKKLGMLAVGVPADVAKQYIDCNDDHVDVACLNSPRSVTLSGSSQALERLMHRLQADDHFARMLQVDFAYHSKYMDQVAKRYTQLLDQDYTGQGQHTIGHRDVKMFSSVTGGPWHESLEPAYWVRNLRSRVQFHEAVEGMINSKSGANFLIEIGPANSLVGPLSQICEAASDLMMPPICTSVAKRGPDTLMALYGVAGKLFSAGFPVELDRVNEYHDAAPSILVDLPNYSWNHTKKHWHESLASKDWRFRPFVKHDLLGSKVPGTPWHSPVWKNKLRLIDNTWLEDHKLGNVTVFPGTGYLCMAMEAMYQTAYMTAWKGDVPALYNFRLRDMRFLKALVLDDVENPPLIMLSLTPPTGSNPAWYQYNISAERHGTWSNHASGYVRIDIDTGEARPQDRSALVPFKYPVSHGKWYKRMREYGFNFGPSFQKIVAMESSTNNGKGRSKVSLQPPVSEWAQSRYLLHPACMDGCFQSVTATWNSDSHDSIDTLIPLQIDSLFIPFVPEQPTEAVSVARSDFTGVGRKEVMRNYKFSCSVYHPESGNLVFDMKGIQYATLGSTDTASSTHITCQLAWDADITMLDAEGFEKLSSQAALEASLQDLDTTTLVAHRFIDLAAHKNPRLRVMEINLNPEMATSLWLDERGSVNPIRGASSQFILASSSADTLVKARQRYSAVREIEYVVFDAEKGDQAAWAGRFDLVVVTLSDLPSKTLQKTFESVKQWLKEDSLALFIDHISNAESAENMAVQVGLETAWKSQNLILTRNAAVQRPSASKDLSIIRFGLNNDCKIQDALQTANWNITFASEVHAITPGSKVLVLDELYTSIMTSLDEKQWELLQALVQKECNLLWVTVGAQKSVTTPDNALIMGLFRTVRNETPFLTLLNLDVEHPHGQTTSHAIKKCLDLLDSTATGTSIDSEFTERSGLIHVARIIPDPPLKKEIEEQSSGRALEMLPFQNTPNTIKLRAERVGNLDSLTFSEISVAPPPLPRDWVEIDVIASGVNFKDLASTIGLVPENEYLLGGEGSGIVTRTGSDVSAFRRGQRVAFFKRGSFGNRVQASAKVVHAIPDSLSFEDAATMPCVFATSIYALHWLANIKAGNRVLIHSATGGVGISAIQICRHAGAEIYATVGTPEKRDFLQSTFGLDEKRIFSSRNSDFAQGILEETGGEGVDIILNSLSGDLLDESWRIIATGGTMVEIGKRDILDRNALSMEPFDRNASFRALDLSHEHISDDTLNSLLCETFRLFERGHIEPIRPVELFTFDKIPDALRRIRSGKHIGKLVISRAREPNLQVPVRRALRSIELRTDVCYLIVGGLRGLCSALAIYLARNGAKHLAVVSRRSHDDPASQQTVTRIHSLGCSVDLLQADITIADDVSKVFKQTSVPVGGIIQGAMVLSDRPFDSMSIEEYHSAVQCKVQGTWNLHNVSLEQGLSLEFFTLLSSISGTYGSKGQANYAAANAFLDAFASYRRSLGLPATAIDLGVVADIGYMAEHDDLRNRYDESIWHVINERHLQKVLGLSIQQQNDSPISPSSATHMITGIRVPQPNHSHLSRDARFSALFASTHDDADTQELSSEGPRDLNSIRVMIRAKSGARAVLDTAVQVLNKYLVKILRVSDELDFTRPLSAYGIDSLAAVEIRNFLKIELKVELTTLDIINASSLVSICERIIEEIVKQG